MDRTETKVGPIRIVADRKKQFLTESSRNLGLSSQTEHTLDLRKRVFQSFKIWNRILTILKWCFRVNMHLNGLGEFVIRKFYILNLISDLYLF